jgi:hypothetical protein
LRLKLLCALLMSKQNRTSTNFHLMQALLQLLHCCAMSLRLPAGLHHDLVITAGSLLQLVFEVLCMFP